MCSRGWVGSASERAIAKVLAFQSTGDAASATFFMTAPSLTLSPTSGSAGSTFSAEASGFTPSETVQLSFDGSYDTASCTTDAAGDCTIVDAMVPTNLPAGSYTVTAQGSSGLSATATFTTTPSTSVPTVTAVSPNLGRTAGGNAVTISGSGFDGGAKVHFSTVAATNVVVVVNSTTITVTSPAGTGVVDVTVTTPGGTSATSSGDLFTYLPPPTVKKVSPASGPTGGGNTVTITGSDFAEPATVGFGTAAATNVVVVNSTTITVTVPAGSVGKVNVTVTTPGSTSATSTADRHSYVTVAPIIVRSAGGRGAAPLHVPGLRRRRDRQPSRARSGARSR